MPTYLISKYSNNDATFHCLFEINILDHQNEREVQIHNIKKVVIGNDGIIFKNNRNGYISWSWEHLDNWSNYAYFRPNTDGFEIVEFPDDETAIFYYKLNY
jgi:hypothetical protein